jgi:excisionase family DNA binding protein
MTDINEICKQIGDRLLLCHKDMLTTSEACAYLGISARALEDMRAQKVITHYKPTAKQVYYKRTDLDAWMMRNEVLSKDALTLVAQEWCQRNKIRL